MKSWSCFNSDTQLMKILSIRKLITTHDKTIVTQTCTYIVYIYLEISKLLGCFKNIHLLTIALLIYENGMKLRGNYLLIVEILQLFCLICFFELFSVTPLHAVHNLYPTHEWQELLFLRIFWEERWLIGYLREVMLIRGGRDLSIQNTKSMRSAPYGDSSLFSLKII